MTKTKQKIKKKSINQSIDQVNPHTVFINYRRTLKPKLTSLHQQKRTSTPGFFEPIFLFCGVFKNSVLHSSYLNKAFCLRKKSCFFRLQIFDTIYFNSGSCCDRDLSGMLKPFIISIFIK